MSDSLSATRSDVSLRDLSYIVEIERLRSFTAAAQALHLSQSALSRAVNETERRIGARLFVRTTRSVEPTPEGTEFIRVARRLLASHRQAFNEFERYREGLSGAVRIASLPSAAAILLPPLLAELRFDRPDITVSVEDTLAHIALDRLLAGDVDYALTTDDWLPEGVTFTPLTSDRFRVVFRPDHAFHGSEGISWREFTREPAVMFGPSSSIRTHTDQILTSLGIAPDIAVEAQNIAVVAGFVAAGFGIAAVPELVIPLMSFAGLESAALRKPAAERPLGLVAVRDRPASPAGTALVQFLRGRLSSARAPHREG